MTSKSKSVDRLSSLHEEILSRILSLIPTKSAVQTSILSKRWRHTWTLVHNLEFDYIHSSPELDRFIKYVDHVLHLCKTPQIKNFRLNSNENIPVSTMSKWITEALRLNVSELESLHGKDSHKVKITFYYPVSHSLDLQSSVNLPCVKILEIVIILNGPSDNVFKIIGGCPVLENLSLRVSSWNNKEDYYFKIPTLKRLELSISDSTTIIKNIVLNVPKLEYLFVDGILYSHVVIEDMSSLVEAKSSCEARYDHLGIEFLKGLSKAKILSLTFPFGITLEDLHDIPKFSNLKQLELNGSVGWGYELIPQILNCCSKLEHLCIEKPRGVCWKKPAYVPTCMLMNLKTMKYTETRACDSNIEFLHFMLGNSKVLKVVTIMSDNMFSQLSEEWMREQLSMVPWASKDCQIHFVRSQIYPATSLIS
ncbi:FBD-like protein [Artemisia annua]|uniref:FBD-like protein n=1 Tax=Artemisia annua TaxID=35608 RepID=A0A2U1NKZ3_ARTAN|nr:FBD-like protein [Artemisia annua]